MKSKVSFKRNIFKMINNICQGDSGYYCATSKHRKKVIYKMQAETSACVWVFTCVRQYEGVSRFGCVGACCEWDSMT